MLLTLDHPSIPTIYGYWTAHAATGPMYFVMDYIPGQTFEQVLAGSGGRVPWRQVVSWGIALCDVLAYLHSQSRGIDHKGIGVDAGIHLDAITRFDAV
jgi:serine/threonine protein kinase